MKKIKLFLAVAAFAAFTIGCASLLGTTLCPVTGEGLTSMGDPFIVD